MTPVQDFENHPDWEEMDKRFTYHPPRPEQVEYYDTIRAKGKDLAIAIAVRCPKSRELSLALTKIEEAIMWANAAIARRT